MTPAERITALRARIKREAIGAAAKGLHTLAIRLGKLRTIALAHGIESPHIAAACVCLALWGVMAGCWIKTAINAL